MVILGGLYYFGSTGLRLLKIEFRSDIEFDIILIQTLIKGIVN